MAHLLPHLETSRNANCARGRIALPGVGLLLHEQVGFSVQDNPGQRMRGFYGEGLALSTNRQPGPETEPR